MRQPKPSRSRRQAVPRRQARRRQAPSPRRAGIEALEPRVLLAGDWQNAHFPLDASGDGVVVPLDALLVINELNDPSISGSQGALPPRADFPDAPFFSTNGDLFVTPIDALLIINALNEDDQGPTFEVGLLRDTAPRGASNGDGVTFDSRVTGRARDDRTGVAALTARVNGGPSFPVPLDAQGRFEFDSLSPDAADGSYTVELQVADGRSNLGQTELTFVLDRTPPSRWTADLAAESDSLPARDGRTLESFVSLTGESEPGVVIESMETGDVLVADLSGRFHVDDVELRPGTNAFAWQVHDAAGNASTFARSFVRETEAPVVTLIEDDRFVTEASVPVDLLLATGTRRLRFDVAARFDESDATGAPADRLLVYLVDEHDAGQTLLDQGAAGTALFAWSGAQAEFPAGLVRFDGRTVEIDVTSVGFLERGRLLFQLLNLDGDTGTSIAIRDLENRIDPLGSTSASAPPSRPLVLAGSELDVAALDVANDVVSQWRNFRYQSSTGRLSAELRVENQGAPLGRSLAVTIDDLPPEAVALNASGFDAAGRPYWNLSPGVRAGGLDANAASAAVLVEFSYAGAESLTLRSEVRAGLANRAPQFTAIPPLVTSPGDVLSWPLEASDPDGDPVSYSLRYAAGLPIMQITADAKWVIAPRPEDVGEHVIELTATDGNLRTTRLATLSVTSDPATTTRIAGRILRIDGSPLAGVRVDVGAVQSLTSSDGSFELDLGTGAIVGDTLKVRGELLSGANSYPYIAEKVAFLLDHPAYEGVRNVIPRPIYLPEIDVAGGTSIDPMTDIEVTVDAIPGAKVLVRAGTLMNQQSTPFTGTLSITEVPFDRTPAALPSSLRPDLVVTIQPGELVFAAPAPLTLPNRAGWPAGTRMDLWSINPTTGEFDVVGWGEVSDDAEVIETIQGGIRNSSWHMFTSPDVGLTNLTFDADCEGCVETIDLVPLLGGPIIELPEPEEEVVPPCCQGTPSPRPEVALGQGNLLLPLPLLHYLSCGEVRGVTLEYDSLRADSRPVFQLGAREIVLRNGGDDIRIAASVTLERDGIAWAPTSDADLQSWRITEPDDFYRVDETVALQADLRGQPSGVYDYTLDAGFHQVFDGRLVGTTAPLTGRVLHVNSADSFFGVGWGLPGLQELFTTSDGSVMRVDGDGTESYFERDAVDGQLRSPAGDFSSLVRQSDGRYLRTFPSSETQLFSADGKLDLVRDRTGQETRYVYDESGRLVRIVDPAGLATQFAYVGAYVAEIRDPADRVVRLDHDARGFLTRIEYPDGESVTFRYDSLGLMTAVTDPLGRTTRFEYGEHGRLVEATTAAGATRRVAPAATRGLGAGNASDPENAPLAAEGRGLAATTVDARGDVVTTSLDRGGQLLERTDAMGVVVSIARNNDNLVRSVTDALGNTRSFIHDERGNVVRQSDAISGRQAAYADLFADPELAALAALGDLQVVDLDQDGHADLVYSAADNGAGGALGFGVAVKYGAGGGAFGERVYYSLAEHHGVSVASGSLTRDFANPWTLADVDSDGDLDLVFAAADSDAPSVRVLVNRDGTWASPRTLALPAGASPIRMVAGDLNGDSSIDLLISNQAEPALMVLLGDGEGDFQLGEVTPLAAPATTLALGEFTGDGRLDVVYGTYDEAASLATRIGRGDGSFESPQIVASGLETLTLELADFDGNDLLDVVVMMQAPPTQPPYLQVYRGDGVGEFAPHSFLDPRSPGEIPREMRRGDVNGDGALDLVVRFDDEDLVVVLVNDGDGTFVESAPMLMSNGPHERSGGLALGDADGDGTLDLFTVDRLSSLYQPTEESNLTFRRGDGNGAFGRTVATRIDSEGLSFAAGDVNGDGLVDVVVAYGVNGTSTTNSVQLLLGLGDGAFRPETTFPIDVTLAESLQLIDLNGDGRLDLVADVEWPPQIEIRLGDGAGGFGAATVLPVERGFLAATPFVFGDIDGDADLDLALGEGRGATLWKNDGRGVFGERLELLNPTVDSLPQISDLEFGDLTGDGRPDLLVHSFHRYVLHAGPFLGNSAPKPELFGDQSFSASFELLDLNGDRQVDVAQNHELSFEATIQFGDGRGGTIEGAPVPRSLERYFASADVDQDGDLDLLSTGILPGDLHLQVNDGSGRFDSFSYPAGAGNWLVTVADVDQDGALDAVVLNRQFGLLTVLLSRANELDLGGGVRREYDDAFSQPTRVTDELGRVTRHVVDISTGNRLSETRIVGAEGGEDDVHYTYTYTSRGLINSATDGLGRVTAYAYDDVCRVASITYAQGTTDEATVHYEYDDAGDVVGVTDELGNTTRYEYDLMGRIVRTELPDPDAAGPLTPPTLRYEYDRVGNLVTAIDANGGVIRYAYDALNRPIEVIDAAGFGSYFTYDPSGGMATVTDGAGRTTAYEYDARHRLVSAADPAGGTTRWTYHADDVIASQIDASGRTTSMEYDERRRLIMTTDAHGKSERFEYDAADNLKSIVDRLGRDTRFEYDDLNRLIATRDAAGGRESYAYDAADNLVRLEDRLGGAYQFVHDARNRRVAQVNPLGGVTVHEFDQAGNTLSITDELGRMKHIEYDALHRPIREFDPLGGRTTYGYDAQSNLTSVTDELGRTTAYEYDSLDRPIRTIDAQGGTRTTAYDPAGNLVLWVDQLERTYRVVYDSLDRPLRSTDPLGGVTANEYDAVGNLRQTVDELGRVTEFEYDELDRLVVVTNPLDGRRNLTYDDAGRLLAETDELERVTRYEYDLLDRLVQRIDPLEGVQHFAYDAQGNLLRSVDQNGLATRFEYDGLERLVRTEDAAGFVRVWEYDDAGNLIRSIDPLGRITEFIYDAKNRQVGVIDARGRSLEYEYDAADRLVSAEDRLGRVSRYAYDSLDRPTSVANPLGDVVSFSYDAVGNLASVTDESGSETTFAYDALNRLAGSTDALDSTITYAYDAKGNLRTFIDAAGRTTRYRYDSLDRRIETTDPLGGSTVYTFDAAGNTSTVTDELERVSRFAYDDLDRLVLATDPLDHSTRFVYDALGNLTEAIDGAGQSTRYEYDALQRRISTIDAVGGIVRYAYDGNGNLVSLSDPSGNVTTFVYDELDRVERETNSLGRSRQFTYDDEGNLLEQTDRNGRVRRFTYDALDRAIREEWLDEDGQILRSIASTFDAVGRLTSAADADSSYSHAYDPVGRLILRSNAGTASVPRVDFAYAYDAAYNLASRVESIEGAVASSTEYEYDALGRMTRVTQTGPEAAEKRVDLAYDAAGQATNVIRYADVAGTLFVASSFYQFDDAGRLTELSHHEGGDTTAGPVIAEFAWAYDSANRLTQAVLGADGTVDYVYDARGQLLGADRESGDDEAFAYDANGNRTGGDYVVGLANQLLADGEFEYAYDFEGNRVSRVNIASGESTEYTWDHRNRLTRVVVKSGQGDVLSETNFVYDVFDARIAKVADADGAGPAAAVTTRYVWDDDHVALEFDDAGSVLHRYLHGPVVDQILADELANREVLWPLSDHLGSVRDVVDSLGQVVNHVSFDSFGNVLAESDSSTGHAPRFAGRELDVETGLYYLRARYLDPASGQFLSEDPLSFQGGDPNLLRYALGNPLSFADPWGLRCVEKKKPLRLEGGVSHTEYLPPAPPAPPLPGNDGGGQSGGGDDAGATLDPTYGFGGDPDPYLATNRKTSELLAAGKGTISRLARDLDQALGTVKTVDTDLRVKPFLPTFYKHVRKFLGDPLLKFTTDAINVAQTGVVATKLGMRLPGFLRNLGKSTRPPGGSPPRQPEFRDGSAGSPGASSPADTGASPASRAQSSPDRDFDTGPERGAEPPRVYVNRGDGRAYYDIDPLNQAEALAPFQRPVHAPWSPISSTSVGPKTRIGAPIGESASALDSQTVRVPDLTGDTSTVSTPQAPTTTGAAPGRASRSTGSIIVSNTPNRQYLKPGEQAPTSGRLFDGGRLNPDTGDRWIPLDLPPAAIEELLFNMSMRAARTKAGLPLD